jgi:hypothetical protein
MPMKLIPSVSVFVTLSITVPVMGYFKDCDPIFGWLFLPISTGWGSASDQQGMNKIMGSEWKYRRNGGHARYEFNGVEYKC